MISEIQPTAGRTVPVAPVYQLKVVLIGSKRSKPAVWRQLQVPGNANLGWLHAVLHVAMGWTKRLAKPPPDGFGLQICLASIGRFYLRVRSQEHLDQTYAEQLEDPDFLTCASLAQFLALGFLIYPKPGRK